MRLRASSSGFARNDAHPHADARAQVTSDNQYKFLMAYMWISVMIIGLVLGLLIGNAHEAFEAGLTEAVEQARGGVEDAPGPSAVRARAPSDVARPPRDGFWSNFEPETVDRTFSDVARRTRGGF